MTESVESSGVFFFQSSEIVCSRRLPLLPSGKIRGAVRSGTILTWESKDDKILVS